MTKNILKLRMYGVFLVITILSPVYAQNINIEMEEYFSRIRNNEVFLRLFFHQMPKGGDLHTHLLGAAYAETFFDIACEENYYLDTLTFNIKSTSGPDRIPFAKDMDRLHYWTVKCIDHWSVRNFKANDYGIPSDEFFFGAFGKFAPMDSVKNYKRILDELVVRAADEKINYLEIMLSAPPLYSGMLDMDLNKQLVECIAARDEKRLLEITGRTFDLWDNDPNVQKTIRDFQQTSDSLLSQLDTTKVAVRFLTNVGRNNDPVRVLSWIYTGYLICKDSKSMIGINIAQPENWEKSIRDYWGHMRMFKYLSERHPDVKKTLHAGELTLGLVPPEDLNWHIKEAVFVAGAHRIGHGVDIAYELDAQKTLNYMRENGIAIEINLSSNEFILGVKDDAHPLLLYRKYSVPLTFSTDDAGVLRTNHTDQFVIAAKRYPELTYHDLKTAAYNSIRYSFAEDQLKEKLLLQLDQDFKTFESYILKNN